MNVFPFRTDTITIVTNKTEDNLRAIISSNLESSKTFSLKDDTLFYGQLNSNDAKLEFGQFPQKNAFRPIIIIKWIPDNEKIKVISFLRLDYGITFSLFLPFVAGIYQSILSQTLTPLVVCSLITCVMILLTKVMYKYSKKTSLIERDNILTRIS